MVDWNKHFNTLNTVAKTVVALKQGYDYVTFFSSLMLLDRAAAVEQMTLFINQLPLDKFDEFEVAYVNFAISRYDVKEKIKALELFAWLKYAETQKFGAWRGFINWA